VALRLLGQAAAGQALAVLGLLERLVLAVVGLVQTSALLQ